MTICALEVEKCIAETQEIRAAIDDLANTKDKAILATYGIVDEGDSSMSERLDGFSLEDGVQELNIGDSFFIETLKLCDHNWFELVENVMEDRQTGISKTQDAFLIASLTLDFWTPKLKR